MLLLFVQVLTTFVDNHAAGDFLFPVTELVVIVNPVKFWGELTIAAHLVMCIGTSCQHLHRLYFHHLHLRLRILLLHDSYNNNN